MSDTFVHFEIPADDLEKQMSFYSDAFGWQFQGTPMPGMPDAEYILVQTTEEGKPGINGGMYKRMGPDDKPRTVIGVESIDTTLEKVSSLGGKVTAEKAKIPGIGWFALIEDPEGNVQGLFEDEPGVS